jgi:hypothetical protein
MVVNEKALVCDRHLQGIEDTMTKFIFVVSFLLLLPVGCQRNNDVQSIKDVPEWLQAKIDTMSLYQEYEGTQLYRYKWRGASVYHFIIPNSTCLYCALYIQSGDTLFFAHETEFQDFLHNKIDDALLWEWSGKF